MTFLARTVLKPAPMATNGCLISNPLPFTSQISCSHASLLIPYRPIKFQLSCKDVPSLSLPSLFSLKRREPLFRVRVVTAREENNPIILDKKEEDEGVIKGDLNWDGSTNDNEVGELPDKEKVYVGNLPYDVDSENLAMLFEQAGVVEMAEIIYNKTTNQSRGFGFVTMSTEEEAAKAVEMFHRYDLRGRLLTVNIAAPRGSRPERAPLASEPSCRIYVGNLPWSVDTESLHQIFSEHGKVVSARVVTDRDSGRSRGFGFVEMSTESEMNDAIASLDGQSLDGRAMRVNAAEERPRRSRF